MHLLPRVAELEERFGDALVVVGVHAGKFVEERRTPNIREACARLAVHHPVVNDRQYRVWRAYAVQAWPTVALVSPDGYLIGAQAGEFEVEPMAEAISAEVERYESEGILRHGVIDFGVDPETPAPPTGPLRYPTRVAVSGERMFVSDTGNHRVLELALGADGSADVTRAFGDGTDGLRDGAAADARFREPQGLALAGETLFVADRRSHAVRAIDLGGGAVSTIAGTGELGGYRIPKGRPGLETALRSPWGIAVEGETLFVAMAGSHQLWSLDLASAEHRLSLVAGNGGENIGDGPALDATLAQPSGLASADGSMWVADSESSAVRSVETGRGGMVRTSVGTGLFQFGDRDGTGDDVLLQHCLDVAVHDGAVLVADTYNGKIKRLDPATGRCEALPGVAGSGEALYEPGGIWAGPEGVFVADTNHHRVVQVDPETGEVAEVVVSE